MLDFLNRILGALARVLYGLSRFQVNSAPANWGLLAVAVGGSIPLAGTIREDIAVGRVTEIDLLILFGALILVALLTLLMIVMRHTIFLAGDEPDPSPPSEETDGAGPMFATGKYQVRDPEVEGLEIRGYFVNVPAVLERVVVAENESVLAVQSNIDADEHKGVWSQDIRDGSVTEIVAGYFYFGWKRRPAIRYKYQDPRMKKPRRAILAFDRTVDRDRVLYRLRATRAESPAGASA